MKRVKYRIGTRLQERGCVLALGFFDGVHRGHRELIEFAVCEAHRRGVPSCVFTFAYGGGIKADCPPIYSEVERDELFSSLGLDYVFVADFPELRDLSPEEFVKTVISDDLGAELAVVGYNYRFGHLGRGDAARLREIMRQSGGDAKVFDEFTLNGAVVSSTRIRELLEEGRVDLAHEMLSVPYFLTGHVEHGRADGRRFGYPTINVPARKNAIRLRRGVYLTAVVIGEKLYTGLTNVGECPSFGSREYHSESFLLDFSGDAYGMETKVYFLHFLREERVFSSARELSEQIEKDREIAEKIKGEKKWQELGLSLR